MAAPAWERLDDFLSLDEFAVAAIFIPQAGAARDPVTVIFDEPFLNAELGEYDLSAGVPRALCKESDVAGLKKHDACLIGEVRFRLDHDPQPDGTGFATVLLSRDFDA